MIKLKFNNKTELEYMIKFLFEHRPYLKTTGNHHFETLIQSVLDDIETKFIARFNKPGISFKISLKTHEMISIVTLWMDTTRPFPSFSDPVYNIVLQKITFLQQKTQSIHYLSNLAE